jgi:putative drug exporter of the RND superfamily
MPGLSQWAVRRPVVALISWFAALFAVIAIGLNFGGTLNDAFDLPDTESTTAQELLSTLGNSEINAESSGATVRIVWSPSSGSAVDPTTVAEIKPLLDRISEIGSVSCVTIPTDPGGSIGKQCPVLDSNTSPTQQLSPDELEELEPAFAAAAAASSAISADGTVAYSTVTFRGGMEDISASDAGVLLNLVKEANSSTLTVGASGEILDFAGQEPPSSELFGILVAIVILLIAFGSIIAAGMPIVVAVIGLAAGQMLVLMVALFMDVATFAPTLAAMIGLGVGIDYALFVLNRYRQAVLIGHPPKQAAMESVNTAGRAVLFAGTTVIFALLGLFILRIGFFNGLALAAGVTVFMVMLSALWLLPATLSLLGTKALGLRLPWGVKAGEGKPEGLRWAKYGHAVQRRPWLFAAVSLALVLILALPTLSLRLGFADASGAAPNSPTRIAYDLTAKGFGPGVNGPFIAAVSLSNPGDLSEYGKAVAAIENTPGVAATNPSSAMLPLLASNPAALSQDGSAGAIFIIPETAPQDEETEQLLTELRQVTAPSLLASTGTEMFIGGSLAVTSDFTGVLVDALPLFLLIVVSLGFIALMILFRSIVVPLTAAITSLLSFAAATGITVAVFQWGWLNELLGVSGTGPIFPFLPIMVFAILFGLSMDYQVFLVSRMREEWDHTGDNNAAVRRGLAGSGKVVVIAAAIMSSVFLAFIPTPENTIKLFGVALGAAVLIDAFVIRLVFIPAIMSIIGKSNWWLPGWLGKILPEVHIEPGEDEVVDDPDPLPAGVR